MESEQKQANFGKESKLVRIMIRGDDDMSFPFQRAIRLKLQPGWAKILLENLLSFWSEGP